jgi:hypothetical protein
MKKALFILLLILSTQSFASFDSNIVEDQLSKTLRDMGFNNPINIHVSNPENLVVLIAIETAMDIIYEGDQEIVEVHFDQKFGDLNIHMNCNVQLTDNNIDFINKCNSYVSGGHFINEDMKAKRYRWQK